MRDEQLFGPENPERVEELHTDLVLAAISRVAVTSATRAP